MDAKKFYQKAKYWAMGLFLASSAKAHSSPTTDKTQDKKVDDTTIVANVPPERANANRCDSHIRMLEQTQSETRNDTIQAQPLNLKQKLLSVECDAVYVIAQFEGVKCQAYKDRAARGLPTIGIGNTVHPNGQRVKIGDRICSEQELIGYVSAHMEKYIFPTMERQLDIEHLSPEQLVALIDLAYNCGSGVFETKEGNPTLLTKNINEYATTGNTKALQNIEAIFNTKVYSGGKINPVLQQRRAADFRIFKENDPELIKAFRDAKLGTLYGLSVTDISQTCELTNILREGRYGRNLPDTIQYELNKPLKNPPKAPRKKIPLKTKKRSGR